MLLFIWIVSLALAVSSLAMVSMLILVRVLSRWRRTARSEANRRAREALVAFAATPDEDLLYSRLKGIRRSIVSEQARDILGLVRGDLAMRLFRVLALLRIPQFERRRLKRGLLPRRLSAADFLSNFNDRATIRRLRRALHDLSPEVRVAAAIALSKIGARFDLERLLCSLERSGIHSKRLAELFEVIFTRNEGRLLLPLMDNPQFGDGMKALIIDGICRTRAPNLVSLIDDMLAHSYQPTTTAALIRSSAVLRHPHALKIVKTYLAHADATLSRAAADAAGRLGTSDAEVLDALEALMSSSDWSIRLAASSALSALGDEGALRLRAAPFGRGLVSRPLSIIPASNRMPI